MYPRKRIDIRWSDLSAGLLATRHGDLDDRRDEQRYDALLDEIERLWSPRATLQVGEVIDHQWLCLLSVRTGFDLALQALSFPAGSEVVVSAITIPHMLDILAHHQLVAIPVDLDMETLTVDVEAMRDAVRPGKTVALLVAHLFGSRMPLDEVARLAAEHDLVFFEDAAQAFIGDDYRGHPGATLSMFSFGSIKSFTALGGAMVRVRDEGLRARMRAILSGYSMQDPSAYFKKLLKHVPLRYVGGSPLRYGVLTRLAALGPGHDHLVMSMTRGFPGSELISRIRERPCFALLAVLRRRLLAASRDHLDVRRQLGESLSERLSPHLEVPGSRAHHRTWWLFPVVVHAPDALRIILQKAGFDAALGSTSLAWVEPPAHRGDLEIPIHARRVMSSILYLPLDPAMDQEALDQMTHLILEYLARTSSEAHPSPSRHQGVRRDAHLAAGRGDPTAGISHCDSELSRPLGADEARDRDARCA